jgi:hypothetical protein
VRAIPGFSITIFWSVVDGHSDKRFWAVLTSYLRRHFLSWLNWWMRGPNRYVNYCIGVAGRARANRGPVIASSQNHDDRSSVDGSLETAAHIPQRVVKPCGAAGNMTCSGIARQVWRTEAEKGSSTSKLGTSGLSLRPIPAGAVSSGS